MADERNLVDEEDAVKENSTKNRREKKKREKKEKKEKKRQSGEALYFSWLPVFAWDRRRLFWLWMQHGAKK